MTPHKIDRTTMVCERCGVGEIQLNFEWVDCYDAENVVAIEPRIRKRQLEVLMGERNYDDQQTR